MARLVAKHTDAARNASSTRAPALNERRLVLRPSRRLSHGLSRVFFCRGFPLQLHPSSGLRIARETFPTPFANPRGKGPSTSIVNFLWGAFNLLVPLYLLSKHPVTVSFEPGFLALVFGALAIGFYLSLHFGKGGRDPKADDAVRAPNTGRRSGA
jgi:hypothetical protein